MKKRENKKKTICGCSRRSFRSNQLAKDAPEETVCLLLGFKYPTLWRANSYF